MNTFDGQTNMPSILLAEAFRNTFDSMCTLLISLFIAECLQFMYTYFRLRFYSNTILLETTYLLKNLYKSNDLYNYYCAICVPNNKILKINNKNIFNNMNMVFYAQFYY